MVERTIFDTGLLPAPLRFDAWRDSIGVVLDVDESRARAPEAFDVRVDTWMLDGLVFSRCAAPSQAFSRSLDKMAGDGIDHYMVQLFLKGGVEMRRGRGAVTAGAGAIVGFDMADVLDSLNSDFDLLTIFIPRRRLAPMLNRPDSIHGQVVGGETGAGRLLADAYRSVHAMADTFTPAEAAVAADMLLRLIAAAMNGAAAPERDPPDWADQALTLKARRFAAANLADPSLTPDLIAAALGVSRARLYRAFAGTGGVQAMVRGMRLRRAFADLVSPRLRGLQISEIAWRSGFSDPAHFTRLFRDHYGVSPREARARGAAALAARRAGPGGLDRRYEDWITAIA